MADHARMGYPLVKIGKSNKQNGQYRRYDFQCPKGFRTGRKPLRTYKTDCKYKAALVKKRDGTYYVQWSGAHNHPPLRAAISSQRRQPSPDTTGEGRGCDASDTIATDSCLYKRTITIDAQTWQSRETDLPGPPGTLENIKETDDLAHGTIEAVPNQVGTLDDVVVDSEPYEEVSGIHFEARLYPAFLNVQLSKFMILDASLELRNIAREAGHEQPLGEGEVSFTMSETSNLVRRQTLRDLVSSTPSVEGASLMVYEAAKEVLHCGQIVWASDATVDIRNAHLVLPPDFLHFVVPIGPCKERCVVILSDGRTWKHVIAWEFGKILLLSPGTILSIGPRLRFVSTLVYAETAMRSTLGSTGLKPIPL
jgi:hypothetical protein